MSTIDVFDLKPEAPPEFRGDFRPIETKAPGLQICEHLPALARQGDKFSLFRSFTHNNSGHGSADHYMLTGYNPSAGFNPNLKPNNERPSHGSIMARKLGPRGAVPPYVSVVKMHNSAGPAYFGTAAAPFVAEGDPNTPGFTVPDLLPPMTVDASRLNHRRALLAHVDRYRRRCRVAGQCRGQNGQRLPTKGLRTHDLANPRARPSTSRPSRLRCGTNTAGTRWANRACWPVGSSKPARAAR